MRALHDTEERCNVPLPPCVDGKYTHVVVAIDNDDYVTHHLFATSHRVKCDESRRVVQRDVVRGDWTHPELLPVELFAETVTCRACLALREMSAKRGEKYDGTKSTSVRTPWRQYKHPKRDDDESAQ